MKTKLLYILLFLSLALFTACPGGDDSSGSSSGDEMAEAVKLIESANNDLNEIKILYREDDEKRQEIYTAIGEKKVAEVKRIAKDVVHLINKGMGFGNSAVEKLERAKRLNTNKNLKKYLGLKIESLRSYLDAFEYRRQLAVSLEEKFTTDDPKAVEAVKKELMEKEENFQKLIKAGLEKSEEANDLAKDVYQDEL